jgi:hypothetical protein
MAGESKGSISRLEAIVFSSAAAIHLSLTAAFSGQTLALVNSGAVNVISALVLLGGLCCLYVAAFRLLVQRRRTKVLLCFAAVGLAYSAFKLGLPYPPALTAALGSALSAIAWVLEQPWAGARANGA